MSTHDEIDELADLAAAGAWTPDAHATSCASCAATLAAAREFRAWASGAITPDAPPADLEDRLIARFRATNTAAARRFRLLPGKRLLKWAAGVAGIAGLIVLGGSFAPPENPPLETLASAQADFRSNDGDNFWAENGVAVDGRRLARDTSVVDQLSDGIQTGRQAQLGLRFNLGQGIDAYDRGAAKLNDYDEALGRVNAARGEEARRILEKESMVTKLEADAQAFVRQKEVELAQQQEVAGKVVFSLDEKVSTLAAAYDKEEPPQPKPEPPKPAMNDLPGVDVKLAQDARKLIRTARIMVEVEGYEAAQAKVNAAAVEEKGFVASADTERLQNGKIRATVTLRVPPERFEALLAKLRALGTVKHQSLGTQDVSKAYVDMEARLGAKQALLDRLKKVLAEAKGSVKELMEVEVQMGATLEQIEALKGELKYLDNQVALATITLELAEKDLGQPFEYVQTLRSTIGLVTSDVDAAYAQAQKAVLDAGGQVVDSKMTRQNDGAATGTIKARVDAAKFPDVRQTLRALGHVETDTVDQQKSARGGEPTSAAPVRVEQATIDLTVNTPALLITRRAQLRVETKDVEAVYLASRRTAEAAGGRVLDGGVSNRSDGATARLAVQVDVDKFAALVEAFKAGGTVKHAVVNQSAQALAVPVREKADLVLDLQSPPPVVGEDHGIVKTVRETFGRSWVGLLWSIEKLFVGLSLAGPWLLAAGLGWLGWRRARRKKPAPAQ